MFIFYSRAIHFPIIKYDLSELYNVEDLMIIRINPSLQETDGDAFTKYKILYFKLKENPKKDIFEYLVDLFFKLNIFMEIYIVLFKQCIFH